jgi:hypothetical protein
MMLSSLTSVSVVLLVESVVILRQRGRAHSDSVRHTPDAQRAPHDALLDELVPATPRYGFESQSLGREGQMG